MRSPYRRCSLTGAAIGLSAGAALVLFAGVHWYLAWISGLSTATFLLYGFDKQQARGGGERVPENVLHGLALAGGFAGGWLGRALFRHKTRHIAFTVVLLFATAIHAALGAWLFFG